MIRYAVDFEALEQAVDELRPTWRARASGAVARMRSATPRAFDPSGPSWSEIKPLYIERQNNKCAYCERRLPDADFGSIEHDVEHYRPKRGVDPWPRSPEHRVGDGNWRGYCMLAYDVRNYCVACKTCNSSRKRSYFPIAGRPGRVDARDIGALNERERPCLPYPLGDIDDDPEAILTFNGVEPVSRRKSGPRRKRARVTIDLLALDRRRDLMQERAMMICQLWRALEFGFADGVDRDEQRDARGELERLLDGTQPHTSCLRAFVDLFQHEPGAAAEVAREARILWADSG